MCLGINRDIIRPPVLEAEMVNKLLEYTDETFRKEIKSILYQIHPIPLTMKVVIGLLEDKLEIDLKDEDIGEHIRKLIMQCCIDNTVPISTSNKVYSFFLK